MPCAVTAQEHQLNSHAFSMQLYCHSNSTVQHINHPLPAPIQWEGGCTPSFVALTIKMRYIDCNLNWQLRHIGKKQGGFPVYACKLRNWVLTRTCSVNNCHVIRMLLGVLIVSNCAVYECCMAAERRLACFKYVCEHERTPRRNTQHRLNGPIDAFIWERQLNRCNVLVTKHGGGTFLA